MQNNILVDNIVLNKENDILDNTILKVTGECIINLFNSNIIKLKIIVEENSSLTINYFNEVKKLTSNIEIEVLNNAKLELNHSFMNYEDYFLQINTEFLGENSSIYLNIRGINNQGMSKLEVNGSVKEAKINNVLDENIRIINIDGGTCTSNPNMFIDTSKVIANHRVAIGNVREDELYYLMSKGISKEKATKLIINGFLIKIIDNDELLIKINEVLKRR